MSWVLYRILVIAWILALIFIIYIQHPLFWASPKWKRLELIKKSKHFVNGQFKNLSKTPLMTYSKISPRWNSWLNLIKKAKEWVRPPRIPSIKTDLFSLDRTIDCLIWFGHSSYFMQLWGKRFLIDPTLVTGSPVPFINKPFPCADVYKTPDIPAIDYLIITHDHYDHLDYFTVKALRNRIWKVVCWLGVWAHFERWGFYQKDIIEMDWDDQFIDNWITITSLPARHFSWRLFSPNNTLWCSFMVEGNWKNIYIAWDGWYDTFYRDIGKRRDIDFAILENGQYSKNWRYIHTLPEQLPQTIKDLNAKYVIPAHNSKYALSTHLWKEPLEILSKESKKYWFNLLTPMIGELLDFNAEKYDFKNWWDTVKDSDYLFMNFVKKW